MTAPPLIQQLRDRLAALPVEKQQQLLAALDDADLLVNMSLAELQALATAAIAPHIQTQLSDLLARNAEGQLSPEETQTLDQFLAQIDQLNLLKARAQYTLQSLNSTNAA